jgi:phosphatidate cytidylyltransferase
VTRVLSALLLLPLVLGTIWWLPPAGTLVLAEIVVVFAFLEYASIAQLLGATIPKLAAGAATMAVCAVFLWPDARIEIAAMAGMVVVAALVLASGRIAAQALLDVAAGVLPLLYIGMAIGALVGVRALAGREALLALLLTVMISDTAQYYGGRTFGRSLLAPTISPKKTREGAITGFVAGGVAMVWLGGWALPGVGTAALALLGATVVALGIAGDLFESLLKRSAGVKDASGLIPGHGGMLDRVDSLLFAAPVYYAFLRVAAVTP